jgi:hypothetical protein
MFGAVRMGFVGQMSAPSSRVAMKKYDKWLILLIVVWLVCQTPVGLLLVDSLYDTRYSMGRHLDEVSILAALRLLRTAVAIGVAVWLARTARRDNLSPWLWATLGLLFSVVAAVLYFVLRIHDDQPRAPYCARCRRDLRSTLLRGGTECPECGERVPEGWQVFQVDRPVELAT